MDHNELSRELQATQDKLSKINEILVNLENSLKKTIEKWDGVGYVLEDLGKESIFDRPSSYRQMHRLEADLIRRVISDFRL